MKIGTIEASEKLLFDLYVDLRKKINYWSNITHQTSQARMGYVGQHLTSLVTSFKGGKSGARGRDIIFDNKNFGEIKTCYRVDQLGYCNDCGERISNLEHQCSCGSKDIERKDDSKWLITIQNEKELKEIFYPKLYYLVIFEFDDLKLPIRMQFYWSLYYFH